MIRLYCFGAVLTILPIGQLSAASQLSPKMEEQARQIESELIAPCCWTQPVSQHYSEVSTQIRAEVRQMLAAGRSGPEILNAYVARYGERILASPPARGFNRLAYILPWAFLVFGSIVLLLILRAWKPKSAIPAPSLILPGSAGEDMDRRIAEELRNFES
jgi:cytochrome c-type biogenesis protein CcmH